MENFIYTSEEGVKFDEFDAMNYIKFKINDLKIEGYSKECISEFILSDDNFDGSYEGLIKFLEKTLG